MKGTSADSNTVCKRLMFTCSDGSYIGVDVFEDGSAHVFLHDGSEKTTARSVELAESERLELATFLSKGISK
jgi:hypothetical protein